MTRAPGDDNGSRTNARTRSPTFGADVRRTTLAQGSNLVIGTATAILTARGLGPQGKGELAVTLLLPVFGAMLSNPSLGASITFHVARGASTPRLLKVATRVVTVTAGVCLLLVVLSRNVTAPLASVPASLWKIGFLLVPAETAVQLYSAVLHGQQRIRTLNRLSVARQLMILTGTAVALLVSESSTSVVVAWGAAALVSAALVAGLAHSEPVHSGDHRSPLEPTLRDLASYGGRAHLGNVLQLLNYRLDVILLGILAGPAAVGIYSVSFRLAELVWQVPNATSFVLFARTAAKPGTTDRPPLVQVKRWTLAISVLSGGLLALVGRPLINVAFSEAFGGAFVPLLLLLPGTVALGFAKVLTANFAANDRPHFGALVAACALVATVTLDILLIPAHGAAGAAVATTISYLLATSVAVALDRRLARSRSD